MGTNYFALKCPCGCTEKIIKQSAVHARLHCAECGKWLAFLTKNQAASLAVKGVKIWE